MKKTLIFLFTAVSAITASLWAYPKPSLIPAEGIWQLDCQLHCAPRQIMVTLPGETKPRRFWYLLYTVTNNTGRDVDFYPKFELMTNTFKLQKAGFKARRCVFEAVRARYNDTIPLLESEEMVTGRILQGQDNARDSVTIFEDFDHLATSVRIFAEGFSNETVKIDYPNKIDKKSTKPKQFLLRKSLMLEYQVPGDKFSPANKVMLYRGRAWIMR